MGTAGHARKRKATAKNKRYKKARALKKFMLDFDQRKTAIENAKSKIEAGEKIPKPKFDEDLPGGGQHYCVETDRHFINAAALAAHKKSKKYRRALKRLREKAYTQDEAEAAAGKTKEPHIRPKEKTGGL